MCLGVGVAVAHVGIAIAAPGSPATGWLINGAFVIGAALCLLRAGASRRERVAWVCVGAGLLCQAGADRYYKTFLADAAHVSQPSVADFGYLAFYPLVGVAIVLMLRARAQSVTRALALDAAVAAFAVLAVVAASVFPNVLTTSGDNLGSTVTNIAYPIADLLLLGLLVGGAQLLTRKADRRLLLVGAALVLFVVADIVYLYRSAEGAYSVGGWVDALWSFAAVALGSAAWQPAPPDPDGQAWEPTERTLATLAFATAAVSAILIWDQSHRVTAPAIYLTVATIFVAFARFNFALRSERDSSERLGLSEARYQDLSLHDPLTGLANRSLFRDRLEHLLSARSSGVTATLMMIDLDRFKAINDSFGHGAGDRMLIEVARRLVQCVRPDDTVARIGGDEFAVLLSSDAAAGTDILVADRIIAGFEVAFEVAGAPRTVAVSLGIANGRAGETSDELMREADVALYAAKAAGRGRHAQYHPVMDLEERERQSLSEELRCAPEHGELRLDYQPIIDLVSGRPMAVEALIRWQHPRRGLLSPDAFIGLAEHDGSIGLIGQWVLREGAGQVARWNRMRAPSAGLRLHVNASAKELVDHGYAARVVSILNATGLDPHRLVIEVTETDLITDIDHAGATLNQLRTVGVQVALDDFGTGYSSLSYLRGLPIGVLKIDRALVSTTDRRETHLLRTIIDLGHNFALTVVAEGIETEEQREALTQMGCQLGQGFLIARPMPAGELEAWLPPAPASGQQPESEDTSLPPDLLRVTETTILLVDDRLDILELQSLILRKYGYQTNIALSGDEALHLAHARRPGLILMDLDMPGRDGFQVAAQFKRDADLASVPIAAWSDIPVERFQTGSHNPFDGRMGKSPAPGSASFGARVEDFLAGHEGQPSTN
jgi:diguanylate cyclase (GGDEF)-like protein